MVWPCWSTTAMQRMVLVRYPVAWSTDLLKRESSYASSTRSVSPVRATYLRYGGAACERAGVARVVRQPHGARLTGNHMHARGVSFMNHASGIFHGLVGRVAPARSAGPQRHATARARERDDVETYPTMEFSLSGMRAVLSSA